VRPPTVTRVPSTHRTAMTADELPPAERATALTIRGLEPIGPPPPRKPALTSDQPAHVPGPRPSMAPPPRSPQLGQATVRATAPLEEAPEEVVAPSPHDRTQPRGIVMPDVPVEEPPASTLEEPPAPPGPERQEVTSPRACTAPVNDGVRLSADLDDTEEARARAERNEATTPRAQLPAPPDVPVSLAAHRHELGGEELERARLSRDEATTPRAVKPLGPPLSAGGRPTPERAQTPPPSSLAPHATPPAAPFVRRPPPSATPPAAQQGVTPPRTSRIAQRPATAPNATPPQASLPAPTPPVPSTEGQTQPRARVPVPGRSRSLLNDEHTPPPPPSAPHAPDRAARSGHTLPLQAVPEDTPLPPRRARPARWLLPLLVLALLATALVLWSRTAG
jgi:hypothetical protein